MKRYLDVRGCRVIDENGHIMGRIDDCIYNKLTKTVYSFYIAPVNYIKPEFILPIRNVLTYEDAVIKSSRLYKINKHFYKKNKKYMLQNLIGKDIYSVSSIRLGILRDFIFDERNGKINALVYSNGFFEDLFNGRGVLLADETTLTANIITTGESSMKILNNVSYKRFTKG